jgi:hypothetical protein
MPRLSYAEMLAYLLIACGVVCVAVGIIDRLRAAKLKDEITGEAQDDTSATVRNRRLDLRPNEQDRESRNESE